MRFGKSLINPWEYLTSNEVPFRAKLVTVQVLVGVGIRAAAANLCLKVPSFWLLVKNGLLGLISQLAILATQVLSL